MLTSKKYIPYNKGVPNEKRVGHYREDKKMTIALNREKIIELVEIKKNEVFEIDIVAKKLTIFNHKKMGFKSISLEDVTSIDCY